MRHGGWHLKARNGDPDAVEKYLRWRYDTSKSLWWPLLNSAESYVERSYMGAKFYDEFHMPRVVFDSVVAALRPEFPDRLPGIGGRGARTTAPLVLKWAACTQIIVEGCLVKTAARQAHMDEDFLNRWFKRAFDFLARSMVPEHVYTPRDEAELTRQESLFALDSI